LKEFEAKAIEHQLELDAHKAAISGHAGEKLSLEEQIKASEEEAKNYQNSLADMTAQVEAHQDTISNYCFFIHSSPSSPPQSKTNIIFL